MEERKKNYIDILHVLNGHIISKRVYPEASSVRVFSLMQDDYIRLDFTTDGPFNVVIGSYIIDELFGRFYLTEEQMPEYDDATGGYKYKLKFEAEYMMWKNYLFMLTTDASGTRVRKESVWYLTNNLAAQLDELCNNLAVLGYSYTYVIGDEVEKAQEVNVMTWDGVSIYAALGQLADTWETEFWVDRDNNVIHFGKCEDDNEVEDFKADDNVAKMTIQQNQSTYANRIYAYGGTSNLPASYRRKLIITATPTGNYYTPDKNITPDMFQTLASADGELSMPAGDNWDEEINDAYFTKAYHSETFNVPAQSSYTITIPAWTAPAVNIIYPPITGAETTQIVKRSLYLVNGGVKTTIYTKTDTPERMAGKALVSAESIEAQTLTQTLAAGGSYFIYEVYVECTSGMRTLSIQALNIGNVTLSSGGAYKSVPIAATFGDVSTYVVFNPTCASKYTDTGAINSDYYLFMFSDEDGNMASAPEGFASGSSLTLDDNQSMKVPTSFYTADTDNPAALARIGETRLQMPETSAPGGYIQRSGITDSQVVELAVKFENIYPDAKMVVSSVTAEEKTDVVKYEGENERTDWQWHEYTLELDIYNDGSPTPLIFSPDYILANQTLQIRFLTAADMGWDASEYADIIKLSGMTFDVSYNRAKNNFTLVRNTDCGCSLPNDTLLPIVGAPCQLIGWDVRALRDTGIIATAEQKLYNKAQEYLTALEESQFTFTCVMCFDYLFDSIPYLDLYTSEDEQAISSEDEPLQVKNAYNVYNLPTEGHRVRIVHEALKTSKTTRVIGYEFKLDKPYDNPTYTIGETQAYSRLAKIERELTKISK